MTSNKNENIANAFHGLNSLNPYKLRESYDKAMSFCVIADKRKELGLVTSDADFDKLLDRFFPKTSEIVESIGGKVMNILDTALNRLSDD